MRRLNIGKDIDLDGPGSATGTAVDMVSQTMPFKAGATVVAVLMAVSWLEAEQDGASLVLEGRESTSDAWATIADVDGNDVILGGSDQPVLMTEIVLPRYVRYRVASATAGDGRGAVYLLGN